MSLSDIALYIALPILGLATLFAVTRLFLGPNTADRIISLDQLGTLGIGIITIYAIGTGQTAILDVVLVIALISFLGTVAFAYYIQQRGGTKNDTTRSH